MSPSLPPSRPVIVAGMHRSGTSMTASFVSALGVDFGDRLLKGDRHNAPGYFEDVDFLAFQRKLLNAGTRHDEPGVPDWGWTESERLETAHFADHLDEARSLVASRASLPLWGFKDPRSTLLLPFWHALMPEARYVLVYRLPWDVVDSISRVRVPTLHERPDLALRAWAFYNRHLLRFYEQHRDVAVLVNMDAMVEQLEAFAGLAVQKLALPLTAEEAAHRLKQRYRPDLLRHMPLDAPLVALIEGLDTEAIALLKALDAAADLPSGYAGEPAMTALQAGMSLYQAVKHEQRRYAERDERLKRLPARIAARIGRTLAGLRGDRPGHPTA